MMKKYQLLKKIGNGNFASVYLASNIQTQALVAVKIMKSHYNIALREAHLLKGFDHPNIIRLLDFSYDPQQQQTRIVLEYVPENTLELYEAEEKGLKEIQIKCILFQTAFGLAYLHERGIIHRDLKPENLLINKQTAEIKLIDLGLAIPTNKVNTDYVATRWYRAPENLLGTKEYTTAIDVFSLGCVIVELALGAPLFPAADNIDQICFICKLLGHPLETSWPLGYKRFQQLKINTEILKRQFKPNSTSYHLNHSLRHLMRGFSSQLTTLIQKMLILNPAHRITCHDILSDDYFKVIRDVIPEEIVRRFQSDYLMKQPKIMKMESAFGQSSRLRTEGQTVWSPKSNRSRIGKSQNENLNDETTLQQHRSFQIQTNEQLSKVLRIAKKKSHFFPLPRQTEGGHEKRRMLKMNSPDYKKHRNLQYFQDQKKTPEGRRESSSGKRKEQAGKQATSESQHYTIENELLSFRSSANPIKNKVSIKDAFKKLISTELGESRSKRSRFRSRDSNRGSRVAKAESDMSKDKNCIPAEQNKILSIDQLIRKKREPLQIRKLFERSTRKEVDDIKNRIINLKERANFRPERPVRKQDRRRETVQEPSRMQKSQYNSGPNEWGDETSRDTGRLTPRQLQSSDRGRLNSKNDSDTSSKNPVNISKQTYSLGVAPMGVPTSPYYPEVKDRLPEKIGGFLKNKYQNHQQAESIALQPCKSMHDIDLQEKSQKERKDRFVRYKSIEVKVDNGKSIPVLGLVQRKRKGAISFTDRNDQLQAPLQADRPLQQVSIVESQIVRSAKQSEPQQQPQKAREQQAFQQNHIPRFNPRLIKTINASKSEPDLLTQKDIRPKFIPSKPIGLSKKILADQRPEQASLQYHDNNQGKLDLQLPHRKFQPLNLPGSYTPRSMWTEHGLPKLQFHQKKFQKGFLTQRQRQRDKKNIVVGGKSDRNININFNLKIIDREDHAKNGAARKIVLH